MAAAVASIPMARLGDPHLDIAPAVLFLAGDDAGFITGQTLGVDGRMFLHARRGVHAQQAPYPDNNGNSEIEED